MSKALPAAVLDSSALLCVLNGEPAAPLFLESFKKTDRLFICAATRAESWLAAFSARGEAGAKHLEELLLLLGVETVPFSDSSLPHFHQGARQHHHKVDDKARLNMGDLFSYALAMKSGLPLFFQGTDFKNTKVQNAMRKLGYEMSAKGVPLEPGIQR